MRIVVVGASVAGVRTAQALRSAGYAGELVLIGEELHHPYDKPPISKGMLDLEMAGDPVPLLSGDELAALDLDLRLGVRATKLDPAGRTVTTSAGDHVGYDRLVIATGARPRTLPGTEDYAEVHTLRTADDAAAVRRQLPAAHRVVVVGAGFIGAEFASSVRYSREVTVIEAQPAPMAGLLGPEVGGLLGAWHAEHGVALITGARFGRFVGEGRLQGVELDDGRLLPADLAVVGVGAGPATEWLEGSGLPVDDGLRCDERLRVLGHTDVHAVGDVAHWPHAFYDTAMRIEHWTNANEHAAMVAADLTGTPPPRAQVPYVWSDQYGHRIQILGRPSHGSPVVVRGHDGEPLLALYDDADGVLAGAVVVDDPRAMMKARKAMTARRPTADFIASIGVPI
jgi:NADPH-dependent 2,4-dienoyl-CoA reductase/sulfur reductase-like enzyme